MLAAMNEAWYPEDQILQRGEKPFFTVFSMKKFFEHNITKNLEVDGSPSKENLFGQSTLFRMGGAKRPPTNFSPVTSTNVEIRPKNFLTFSFNSFATLV